MGLSTLFNAFRRNRSSADKQDQHFTLSDQVLYNQTQRDLEQELGRPLTPFEYWRVEATIKKRYGINIESVDHEEKKARLDIHRRETRVVVTRRRRRGSEHG